MPRTRSRQPVEVATTINGSKTVHFVTNTEQITESSVPGPCNVVHTRTVPMNITFDSGGNKYQYHNHGPWAVPTKPPSLNWSKLPSSSEFGIIQFFAELDDTVAMFSKKFVQSFSYGAFTWGILPFLNDAKNLLKTIDNLSKSLEDIEYEDAYTQRVENEYFDIAPGVTFLGNAKSRYTIQGVVNIDITGSDARILLDRLGFHPDLSTAWDLVPLSFAADWLFPFGDYVSRLHNRGWVSEVAFHGWSSKKSHQSMTHTSRAGCQNLTSSTGEIRSFERSLCSIPLAIDNGKWPPSSPPLDMKKAFNLAYLAGLSKVEQPIRNAAGKRMKAVSTAAQLKFGPSNRNW